MHRTLAHRLTRLEQQVLTRDLSMWKEVDAALARLRTHARARVEAYLIGSNPPTRDTTQVCTARTL
jgi:hypothetical protein